MVSKYDFKYIIEKRNYPKWLQAPINDDGESLDLYIATYPVVAKYLAKRIGNKNKTFAELCCGIGVSLIYFSNYFKKLIGVDLNKDALEFCNENLNLAKKDKDFNLNSYKIVEGNIENLDLIQNLSNVDVIAYDIPYWFDHGKNLTKKNPDIVKLINSIKENITLNIVIYAPPHFQYNDILDTLEECEFEQVYVNGKYDRNLIYFGNLIQNKGITKVELKT